MKKVALILGIILSATLLAGCATQASQQPTTSSTQVEAPVAHKDLKGERL